jgi:hypothetical protein
MVAEAISGIEPEVVEAFHKMWDHYPSVVMLIQADRSILAVNLEGERMNIQPGIRCFRLAGRDKVCDHCMANEALREGKAKRFTGFIERLKQFRDSYWVPVAGEINIYVHFGNDITLFVREELCGKIKELQ